MIRRLVLDAPWLRRVARARRSGSRLAGDFSRRMRENGRNSVRRPRHASSAHKIPFPGPRDGEAEAGAERLICELELAWSDANKKFRRAARIADAVLVEEILVRSSRPSGARAFCGSRRKRLFQPSRSHGGINLGRERLHAETPRFLYGPRFVKTGHEAATRNLSRESSANSGSTSHCDGGRSRSSNRQTRP